MCNSYKYEHIDTAENVDIIMPMYNLMEYTDNYSKVYGSLKEMKKNIHNGNPDNVTAADSTSFKYKSSILGNLTSDEVLKKMQN